MVRQGVKNLILLSRSGKSQDATERFCNELTEAGCEVAIYGCDVADASNLQRVLKKCATSMPPIRGVIQAAMALKV